MGRNVRICSLGSHYEDPRKIEAAQKEKERLLKFVIPHIGNEKFCSFKKAVDYALYFTTDCDVWRKVMLRSDLDIDLLRKFKSIYYDGPHIDGWEGSMLYRVLEDENFPLLKTLGIMCKLDVPNQYCLPSWEILLKKNDFENYFNSLSFDDAISFFERASNHHGFFNHEYLILRKIFKRTNVTIEKALLRMENDSEIIDEIYALQGISQRVDFRECLNQLPIEISEEISLKMVRGDIESEVITSFMQTKFRLEKIISILTSQEEMPVTRSVFGYDLKQILFNVCGDRTDLKDYIKMLPINKAIEIAENIEVETLWETICLRKDLSFQKSVLFAEQRIREVTDKNIDFWNELLNREGVPIPELISMIHKSSNAGIKELILSRSDVKAFLSNV